MRHKRKFNHLSRKAGHRNAMLSNMATSLIMHKRIFTTVAKAKALRQYVEPVITKAKEDTTHSRRVVFGLLQNKAAVTELFQNVSQKVADRPGGYTRIIKTGFRLGDNAAMCFIELVDYNENMLSDTSKKRTRTRRSRRRKSSDASKATVDTKAQETTKSEKADEAKQPKTDEAPKKEAAAENKKPEKVEEVSKEEKQEIKEEKKAESIEAKADTHNPGTDDNKDVPLPRDNA